MTGRRALAGVAVLSTLAVLVWGALALWPSPTSETVVPTVSEPVTPPAAASAAPESPTPVCGKPILNSPYDYDGEPGTFAVGAAPRGLPTFGTADADFPDLEVLVVIAAGDNNEAAGSGAYEGTRTLYYFAPGTHRIDLLYAGNHNAYIGGYTPDMGKAVLDGVDGGTGGDGQGGANLVRSKASSGDRTYNTWMYLTIQNYASSVNSAVMGNVNGGGAAVGDIYRYNTIGPNQYGYRGEDKVPAQGQSSGGGYGINLSDHTMIEHNCLTENAQGGFNGWGVDITISDNEVSNNGLGLYPDTSGPGASPHACGCSGGGKLTASTNATLQRNYVHDNYNAGIWLDFNNTGADISLNYIESNWGTGIFYEASYNAHITDNTLVGNGWASNGPWPKGLGGRLCFGDVDCTIGEGPITGAGGRFPYSAIYVANSGGNPNITAVEDEAGSTHASRFPDEVVVRGNVLTDNFGGVNVYTDTDRYPDGVNNNSACSVPLNAGNPKYYRQTRFLLGGPATVSGSAVEVGDGLTTLCSNYASGAQENGFEERVATAPNIGMGVYDMDTGTFLGNVAAASSPSSFTLDREPGDVSGATLLLSAHGGCGPASYFGSGPGVSSGTPALPYWDNCIWGSRNVTVTGNTFTMSADRVTGCTVENLCGYMQAIAFNAGVPELVRYFQAYPDLVAAADGGLGNVWKGNVYLWTGGGPGGWQFQAGPQGNVVSRDQWQADPYGQDAGSLFGDVARSGG